MEYTYLIHPILLIFLSLFIGMFLGALWAYYQLEKDIIDINKEIDAKNKILESMEIDCFDKRLNKFISKITKNKENE
jgi:cell division protein FtsL|tara:strand:- start:2050 stop:2280 length:231 start_codon:yes stop_codon:yes gene_type:complete